jgi:hypothetical protein
MKNFVFASLLLVLLVSCSWFKKYDVLIDNPTSFRIFVEIGDETYEIEAYSFEEIKLKSGEHKVVAWSDETEVFFDNVVKIDGDGILNPTLTTYVLWKDLYVNDMADYEKYAAEVLKIRDQVTIADKTYNDVDFTVYEKWPFIKALWNFGLFEPWTDELDIHSGNYQLKSKIYRVEDLEEEWGYWGEFDMADYTEQDFKNLIDSILEVKNERIHGR